MRLKLIPTPLKSYYWLYLCLIALINSVPDCAASQTIDSSIVNSTTPISQIPSTPPPQDVVPSNEPRLPVTPTPEKLPPSQELLQSPPSTPTTATPTLPPGEVSKTFIVERFNVVGSTVFSPEELDVVLAPFTNRPLTLAELLQARSAITQLYVDNGYINTSWLSSRQY